MARHGLLALTKAIDVSQKDQQHQWLERDIKERLSLLAEWQTFLQQLHQRIEAEWQIGEKSITISCWKYVWTIAFTCLLVGGGLAIGFALGQRGKGVDPFNITLFCWTLADFILIVAKSSRVQDWPWRDFMRGQVVCRNLTEVCAVENVDPQDVLAWLLQNERSTVLETRGPYNKVFSRRADDGFSIDRMIELGTMMLTGIIVDEVLTQLGPALVCLDVRPGVEYGAFVHSQEEDEEEEKLACVEPPSRSDDKVVATLLPMRTGWYKILGIHNVPTRHFR
jgi:hypothetical protein